MCVIQAIYWQGRARETVGMMVLGGVTLNPAAVSQYFILDFSQVFFLFVVLGVRN